MKSILLLETVIKYSNLRICSDVSGNPIKEIPSGLFEVDNGTLDLESL